MASRAMVHSVRLLVQPAGAGTGSISRLAGRDRAGWVAINLLSCAGGVNLLANIGAINLFFSTGGINYLPNICGITFHFHTGG